MDEVVGWWVGVGGMDMTDAARPLLRKRKVESVKLSLPRSCFTFLRFPFVSWLAGDGWANPSNIQAAYLVGTPRSFVWQGRVYRLVLST